MQGVLEVVPAIGACLTLSNLQKLIWLADQQQIEYVTSKVSMVETMHDGLRLAMANLRTDVQDGMQPFTILLFKLLVGAPQSSCQCCCSWYIPHKSCWQLQQQICTVPGKRETDLLHALLHNNLLSVCLSLTLTSLQGFGNKIEQLQAANVAAHEKLTKGMSVS